LDTVGFAEIERLYRNLIEQKGLAVSSVQRIHAALTVPFHGAVREGIISVNPMSLVVKPRAPKPPIRALTAPNRQALWAVIHDMPVGEQLRWVFTPPKSAQGVCDIPLGDHTVELFIAAVRGLPAGRELVFPDPEGTSQHSSTHRKTWLRLLQSAGIPELSLHTVRHTAATVTIAFEVDVKTG
jgi:integrase